MKPLALLPLLLLAACNPPFESYRAMTDPVCRRQAEEDAEVKRETARYAAGVRRDRSEMDAAMAAAYERCMRTREGDTRKGGVERVRRLY